MFLSKKKLIVISNLALVVFGLFLFGTPAYNFSRITTTLITAYDFSALENVAISSILGTLVCLIGVIGLINLTSNFISKISDKFLAIFNISAWSIGFIFSIVTLCSRYINGSYVPQNSLIFVLLITIIAIITSIYLLVYQPNKD